MKAAALTVLLASCAPTYSLATRREPPVWLFAADMAAFSAGMCIGLNEYNKPGHDGNDAMMWSGFGLAALSWGSYWVIDTTGRR